MLKYLFVCHETFVECVGIQNSTENMPSKLQLTIGGSYFVHNNYPTHYECSYRLTNKQIKSTCIVYYIGLAQACPNKQIGIHT